VAFTAWQQYTVAADLTKRMEGYFPNGGVDEPDSGHLNRGRTKDKLKDKLRAIRPWRTTTVRGNEVCRITSNRVPGQISDNENRTPNRVETQAPNQQWNPTIMADNINGPLSTAILRQWAGS